MPTNPMTAIDLEAARRLCGLLALTADQHARHPYTDSGIPCGCASCVLAPMLPALLDALAQARAALAYAARSLEVIAANGCSRREPDLASFTCEEKYPNADDLWCSPCFASSELARVRGLASRVAQEGG